MCKVLLNEELKGIELYFNSKPAQEVREEMKANNFRWNGKKSCWYAKQSEKTISLGNKLSGSNEVAEVKPAVKKNNIIDLYELTTIKKLEKNIIYDHKEVAKQVRNYLKKRFPFVKFSIRCNGNSINCDIVSSPFEENSKYLKAIKEYCVNYVDSFNYNNSDSMTDYFDVNFYGGHFQTSWEYQQTEPSEEIIKAMENFDIKYQEVAEAEEMQRQKEYQEYLIKREEERKEAEERQKQEKKDQEYIINNVEVVEVEEKNQYYIKNAQFANLNKNNTLDQYQEEVEKGDFYYNTLKVTREIHFKDSKSFNLYSNMLLHDFDFIKGTGGSYTDDLRVNSMTDYYNMNEEEKNSVQWLLTGIAVYLNDELMFVVDAQGYSYSRYIGLIGETSETTKEYIYKQVVSVEEIEERKIEAEEIKEVYNNVIEKNSFNDWYNTRKLIADTIKENVLLNFSKETIQQITEEKIKSDLYRVLKEVDTIQDQFKGAELKQGDKLTLIRGAMIGGASISYITFNDHINQEYAQYKDNVKMTMNVKSKKGLYEINLHDDDIIIYRNWIDIPTHILYEDTSNGQFTGTMTKYSSYDKKALDDIITHLQEKNILPVINTYEPVF